MNGFVLIHRSLLEHPLWENKTEFDERSAWIDLILRANFRDKTVMFRGYSFTIKRGQLLVSMSKLAEKWKWSENRVRRYLKKLKREKMLTINAQAYGSILTIENYALYQDVAQANGRGDGRGDGSSGGRSGGRGDGTLLNNDNNITKINKETNNNIEPPAPCSWGGEWQ